MKQYRAFVWAEANEYLASRVEMSLVREYMSIADSANLTTMPELYRAFIDSLSNRQGMPNSIGDIARLAPVLCGFDHLAVQRRFSSGWESLFDAIEQCVKPTSRMDKTNSHNYWVIFCKGCLSVAKYLSGFDSADDFLSYVREFDANPRTRPALPLLIEYDVFGFRFALACDFLKEIGFVNYSKPDTHIKDIFCGLGLSDDGPLDVFRAVTTMATELGETPYAVDKLFWLIGSGRLYNHGRTFPTDKGEFVKVTLEKWRRRECVEKAKEIIG